MFANFTVHAGAVEGLSPQPTPDPTAHDPGIVRHWQLGPQTLARFGHEPSFSEAPSGAAWTPVSAGRFGFVNLNREFTLARQSPSLTWLRTSVSSDTAQQKLVQLGWLGQVWIFVNGKLITQGKNFYEPESERREQDGRLSVENGSFLIPLQKGSNRITVVLSSAIHDNSTTINYYGWATILRFANAKGLHFSGVLTP